MYVITTKGLESLKSLDTMSKELKKVASIIQKTSSIGKFMLNEAIERIAMFSDIEPVYEKEMQVYSEGKQ
jgi:hypothetical protein